MVFGELLGCLRFQRITGHVHYSHGTHRQILMPKVQLDEHVSFVVDWREDFTGSLEVHAVLLYPLQEK